MDDSLADLAFENVFRLQPTDRLLLHNVDKLLYVQSGKVDLFVLELKQLGPGYSLEFILHAMQQGSSVPIEALKGPLTFMAAFCRRDMLLPFPLAEGRGHFFAILVATQESKLCCLSVKELERIPALALERDFAKWIDKLAPIFTSKSPSAIDCYLPSSTSFTLHTAEIAFCPKESLMGQRAAINWLSATQGSLLLAGSPAMALTSSSPPFPFPPLAWVQGHNVSKGRLSTHMQPPWNVYWQGLLLYNRYVLHTLAIATSERTLEEQAQLALQAKSERQSLQELLQRAKSLFSTKESSQLATQDAVDRSLKAQETNYVASMDGKSSFWQLLKCCLQGRKKDLCVALSAALLGVVVSLFIPVASALLLDEVLPNSDYKMFWGILLGLTVAAFSGATFMTARELAILRLEGLCYYDIECLLWKRLLNMPLSFFRRFSTGNLLQRLEGVGEIRTLLSGHAIRVGIDMLFSFCYLLAMFYYSPSLSLIALSLLLVVIVIFAIGFTLSLKIYQSMTEIEGDLYGKTVQTVQGVSKIRTNGAEERIFLDWLKTYLNIKELFMAEGKVRIALRVISDALPLVFFLFISSAIFLWEYQRLSQQAIAFISLGSYIAFSTVFADFSLALIESYHTLMSVIGCFPLWKRSKIIFEEKIEHLDKASTYHLGTLTGQVRIDHLYFRYDPSGPYVHEDISLHAEPGEFIAIVGHSGCGKSTLVRLLLGFENLEMGGIYYNGKNLSELNLQDVRSQIGTVLQNSMILHGNIRENITGGRTASDEEVMRAIKLASFDKDLAGMPMGLRTPLISGGNSLSGGQRQRIFLARALLGNPKILILDEATNALDNETQEAVSRNLDNCYVTRIVIAHRLSTIKNAHRIYVMHQGKIVQKGSFAELLEEGGLFKEFVDKQKL